MHIPILPHRSKPTTRNSNKPARREQVIEATAFGAFQLPMNGYVNREPETVDSCRKLNTALEAYKEILQNGNLTACAISDIYPVLLKASLMA